MTLTGVLALVCVGIMTATVTPVVAATGCDYQGTTYSEGERFSPDACTRCTCRGGRPECLASACAQTPCVDSVSHPDRCCPVCPNGPNCRGSDGKTYAEGTGFSPDPCTHCTCRHGGQFPQCLASACAPPPCVDPVRDPNQCCAVCPNGPNCRAPDGTTIQAGQHVQINPTTTCQCDQSSHSFFMSLDALCAVKQADQVIHHTVN